SEVERTDREGVATLTLNRPESLNALSPQLFVELRAHVDAIAKDTDGIGCVILCGAGKSFSSGNDLRAIQAGETAPTPEFQAETLDAIEAMPQPVVAAVRGHCYTGALEVVLACDLLIASDSAKFSDTHGKWGMTPTWGMSQRLPRRVGLLNAKDMMFTGRVVLDARAAELAAAIAANSWYTLRADKQLVNEGQRYTLADGLAFERANSFGATPDTMKRLKEFGGRKKKS
ncbi:MAG: enoyl-CoA hydratase/isomerase family protein, partial [Deltaproteobacteria bacterium]|nr:enoyl-CoA hydratase/isomerase family protein [Deltaproteobacteria bacterium]